jgi:hypothetical protein
VFKRGVYESRFEMTLHSLKSSSGPTRCQQRFTMIHDYLTSVSMS